MLYSALFLKSARSKEFYELWYCDHIDCGLKGRGRPLIAKELPGYLKKIMFSLKSAWRAPHWEERRPVADALAFFFGVRGVRGVRCACGVSSRKLAIAELTACDENHSGYGYGGNGDENVL